MPRVYTQVSRRDAPDTRYNIGWSTEHVNMSPYQLPEQIMKRTPTQRGFSQVCAPELSFRCCDCHRCSSVESLDGQKVYRKLVSLSCFDVQQLFKGQQLRVQQGGAVCGYEHEVFT